MSRTSTFPAMRSLRALWLALLVAATGAGCGTTATITDTSGASREVEIIRGNATHLIVQTADGRIVLRKDEIADIDHPGNALATVGAALLMVDLLWLVSPGLHCGEGRQQAFCMGWVPVATFAGIGLEMTTFGTVVWNHSHEMATQVSSPSLALAPLLLEPNRHESPRFGAALLLRY